MEIAIVLEWGLFVSHFVNLRLFYRGSKEYNATCVQTCSIFYFITLPFRSLPHNTKNYFNFSLNPIGAILLLRHPEGHMKILTLNDMVKLCGTTRNNLQMLNSKGRLPFIFKVGRQLCSYENDFMAWVKENPQYQKVSFVPKAESTLDSIVLDLKKILSQCEALLKKQNATQTPIFSTPQPRVPNPIKPVEVEPARLVQNGSKVDLLSLAQKTETREFKWKT